MSTPTYGGQAIFGLAVAIKHTQNPTAAQITSFFGVKGQQTLYAGSRGRVFMVRGCLYSSNVFGLNAAEDLFESIADGTGRTLVDTRGRIWNKVIFRGEFQQGEGGYQYLTGGAGVILPYTAVFHGLI